MRYFLLLFLPLSISAQIEKFIPLDEDTHDLIHEVNYTLYHNQKPVFQGITSIDTVTILPKNIAYDSIALEKPNFKSIGIRKEFLKEILLLKKITYELDEVVISSQKRNLIEVGERTRFIKRSSNSIPDGPNYGILFSHSVFKNRKLRSLNFYVEKVKYKTNFKIKFYTSLEHGSVFTHRSLKLTDLIYESEMLTIEKGSKNKIEVNLDIYDIASSDKNIFVCLELDSYYDEKNNQISPEFKDQTKLKFQQSNHVDYYSKTVDYYTKEMSKDLKNINELIIHDYRHMFFKAPHKSILIAPAITLVFEPL